MLNSIRWFFYLLLVILGACAAPVAGTGETVGVNQAPLPIVHECGARSSLQVGTYTTQWANWSLSVDSSNFAYVVLTTDSGVTAEAHGGMPLTVRLSGDSVDFTVTEDGGRATFTQPYPGLAHGYGVEVPCVR
jgi:hypothetical protein